MTAYRSPPRQLECEPARSWLHPVRIWRWWTDAPAFRHEPDVSALELRIVVTIARVTTAMLWIATAVTASLYFTITVLMLGLFHWPK